MIDDGPQYGGLIDKHFIYTMIIIMMIIFGAFAIISKLDIFGEKFHGGSWYIYCDLKAQTCSCNVYGLLDEPQIEQMKLCADFMKEQYTVVNRTTPVVVDPKQNMLTP